MHWWIRRWNNDWWSARTIHGLDRPQWLRQEHDDKRPDQAFTCPQPGVAADLERALELFPKKERRTHYGTLSVESSKCWLRAGCDAEE
jgi:hypothetical protein